MQGPEQTPIGMFSDTTSEDPELYLKNFRTEMMQNIVKYKKINRTKTVRGVIEVCYSSAAERTEYALIYSMIRSFMFEFGSGCGGSVCSYCMKAIPIKTEFSDLLHNHLPVPKHFVTGSAERCRCKHYLYGMYREDFHGHQSNFFIDHRGYALLSIIKKQLKEGNTDYGKLYDILAESVNYIRMHHRNRGCNVNVNPYFRIVAYDICMTTRGQLCKLCCQRRIAQKDTKTLSVACEECVFSLNFSYSCRDVDNVDLDELTVMMINRDTQQLNKDLNDHP